MPSVLTRRRCHREQLGAIAVSLIAPLISCVHLRRCHLRKGLGGVLGSVVVARATSDFASFFCSSIAVRIEASTGGEVSHYLELFAVLRQSGERIVIDGPCY